MLKKISPLICSDLLKILNEMGHGDEIAIVDANYPAAASKAKHTVIANGITSTQMLDAILDLLPVDTFVKQPIKLMEVVPGDNYKPIIWDEYKRILAKYGLDEDKIQYIERFEYYEHCNRAYCVVSTGERARYGNLIIKKGVLEADA